MIFKPRTDRIVAVPEEASRKTSTGISTIKGGSNEQPRIARAIEVGPDVMDVEVGDRFLFQAFAAADLQIGKEKYIVIREEFVDSFVEDSELEQSEEDK